MGYNSSGLNIVLERLLLATRRPSTHYPLASGAAFFDPLRAICRRATNHLQHTAQHLATPCKPSAVVLRSTWDPLHSIRHLAACHPLAPAPHPSALCMPSARQFTARYPPAHRKPSAISLRAILWPLRHIRRLSACHLPASSPRDTRQPIASHPPSYGTASFDPRASSAGTLQASAGTNRCP